MTGADEYWRRHTGELNTKELVRQAKRDSVQREVAIEADAAEQRRRESDAYNRRKSRDNALAIIAGIIGAAVLIGGVIVAGNLVGWPLVLLVLGIIAALCVLLWLLTVAGWLWALREWMNREEGES